MSWWMASWTSCTPHSERRRRSHSVPQRSCRAQYGRRHGRKQKIKHNQEEVNAHPQKPRRLSPWRLQGSQVMNIPMETQQKWKQIAFRDGHHARFPHLVAAAVSIVLHVSNNMNEVKKYDDDSEDGEEEGETAAAKETEEISRKDAEIRRLIDQTATGFEQKTSKLATMRRKKW